jgi:hypothetical protein
VAPREYARRFKKRAVEEVRSAANAKGLLGLGLGPTDPFSWCLGGPLLGSGSRMAKLTHLVVPDAGAVRRLQVIEGMSEVRRQEAEDPSLAPEKAVLSPGTGPGADPHLPVGPGTLLSPLNTLLHLITSRGSQTGAGGGSERGSLRSGGPATATATATAAMEEGGSGTLTPPGQPAMAKRTEL